jgi:hypothetical protein
MVVICSQGLRISSADKKALENDLLDTPFGWARKCLDGMVNKAIKSIMRRDLELFKSKQTESIPASVDQIISGIVQMPEFTKFNSQVPALMIVMRDEPRAIEVWPGGFTVLEHEKLALDNFYEDHERQLYWFMENKINECRKRFVKEWTDRLIKDKSVASIPVKQDSLIALVTARPDYKNRAANEAEALANRTL